MQHLLTIRIRHLLYERAEYPLDVNKINTALSISLKDSDDSLNKCVTYFQCLTFRILDEVKLLWMISRLLNSRIRILHSYTNLGKTLDRSFSKGDFIKESDLK